MCVNEELTFDDDLLTAFVACCYDFSNVFSICDDLQNACDVCDLWI